MRLRRFIATGIFIMFFAAVGSWLLFTSHASTPTASVEAETGVPSVNALKRTDSTASNGNAIAFTASTDPSGQPVPLGNLPGWTETATQDFNTTAAIGSFQSVYTPANHWCSYSDSTKYTDTKVLSAHNSMMDFNLDGTLGGAGYFVSNGVCGSNSGQLYGRFSIRFKVTGASGYGTAMMVWPSSDYWSDGEIDYPEGNFNSTFSINQHPTNCPSNNCGAAFFSLNTKTTFTSWHTATTEWTPAGVKYYLDGSLIATTTTNVPVNNHRMTVQMAPTATPAQAGHYLVDWVALYSYTP